MTKDFVEGSSALLTGAWEPGSLWAGDQLWAKEAVQKEDSWGTRDGEDTGAPRGAATKLS